MLVTAGTPSVHLVIGLLMWVATAAVVLYLAYLVIRRGVRDGMLDAHARSTPPPAGDAVPPTG